LGENRVGTGPNVGHIRQHDAAAIRRKPHLRFRWRLRVDTNGGGNAEADKPPAVAYRSWPLPASFPLETTRSFAQAVDDTPLRVRYILLRIDCGLVPDAQVDRIHVEGMREFVHRGLKRQQAGCFARSTHVLAAQHV
jgi:hypothetical protein